jgi:cytochrome c-type biogenesis protein CcmF
LHELLVPGLGVSVAAIVLASLGSDGFNVWIALAVLLAGWVALGVVKDLWRRIATGVDGGLTWRRLTPSFLGMALAHLGFAAVVLGAVVVSQENEERDLRMAVGDIETLGAYRFELMSLGQQAGPNYLADQAVFEVRRDQELIAVLVPEKRRYFASGQIMTEAAIDARLWRDLYIALGEPIGEQAWAVRLQYKPMVRWLWLGALMIGLGALVTAFDRRYRSQRSNVTAAQSGVAAVAG